MKILVCVKQVPDTESTPQIDAENIWVRENSQTVYRMNRYDEYALEEAVQIKEALPEVAVDALSVGPDRVRSTVKKALEKGADNGIHIRFNKTGFQSYLEIASLIAGYAQAKYDLIFTGVMAEDDMQSQVGPAIASLLDLPCAPSVIREEFNPNEDTITVETELEGGIREKSILTTPALLTIQSGINRPRYPSLSNVMRARTQEIITVDSDDISIANTGESIVSISYPEISSKGIFLGGNTEEKAEKLLRILHKKSLL